MAELAVYDNDPTLYLFTSLTAGSSHIVTATSRIETILKANKIPFKGVDTATDDLARKLFQRRAHGKKLPLLVKEGYVLGDLEMIEEWNEYDELKEALGFSGVPAPVKPATTTTAPAASSTTAASAKTDTKTENTPLPSSEQNLAIRQLGAEAAKLAASKKPTPTNISTTNPLLAEKVNSPAASSPKIAEKADPSGILSPRSIPLPSTPSASRPHLGSSSSAGSDRSRSFHGADVEDLPEEEIRKIEQEEAIAEVSSTEEEDTEEEKEQRRRASETLSGTKVEPLADSAPSKAVKQADAEEKKNDSTASKEATQKQDAKAAEKAGDSVQD